MRALAAFLDEIEPQIAEIRRRCEWSDANAGRFVLIGSGESIRRAVDELLRRAMVHRRIMANRRKVRGKRVKRLAIRRQRVFGRTSADQDALVARLDAAIALLRQFSFPP